MTKVLPRLMIAAEKSGGGKTTLVCALLQALIGRGLNPAACKCGPDFIDPLFHSEVIGARTANLDLFFTAQNTVKQLLCDAAEGCDIAVLEGVMGYYDGVGGSTDFASSYHLAAATQTPVVLVMDARGSSLSLCAALRGFTGFRPNSGIAGVILNRCTAEQYARLVPLLQSECGVTPLGYLPVLPDCALQSRHLGLVTADEVENLKQKLSTLADQLNTSVDIDALLSMAGSAPALDYAPEPVLPAVGNSPRIAVARDRAFCFYYRENLALLQKLGAELVEFSPLADKALPPNADALYLGGGYPELYAHRLSQNTDMLAAIRSAVQGGMPTLAECGGFLYLHSSIADPQGVEYPMAGVFAAGCRNAGRLGRFGYINLTAREDNLLCDKGGSIPAHEFHYWDSDDSGAAFDALKPIGGRRWQCAHTSQSLFAGFPHLYFYGNTAFAARFVAAAGQRKGS